MWKLILIMVKLISDQLISSMFIVVDLVSPLSDVIIEHKFKFLIFNKVNNLSEDF